MEWIAPLLLTFLVLGALAQLVWSYSMSAIAEKGGQGDLMCVLAWIPILQIAPMIVAGGGSIPGLLLGTIGLFMGCVALGAASAFIGGGIGTGIGMLGLLFITLLALSYFGRIAWTTATTRELPGWYGLLVFVPVANLFIYPYIAFHDGWAGPNKIGLVIGLVLAIGSTAPSFRAVELMQQEGFDLAALSSDAETTLALGKLGDLGAALSSGASAAETEGARNPSRDGDATAAIRALFSLQGSFEVLEDHAEAAAGGDPEQRRAALALLRSLDAQLDAQRDALDPRTFHDLSTHLVQLEARLAGPASSGAQPVRGGLRRASHRPSAPDETSDSPRPAAVGFLAEERPAPTRPLPVHPQDGCPEGTQLQTQQFEDAEEEWCQQRDEDGGLRHGWFARYDPGGRPESMGEYANGLRVGVWTRFYASGEVRAQAQFRRGLQHGWLLSFDKGGKRTKAVRFDQGVAVP